MFRNSDFTYFFPQHIFHSPPTETNEKNVSVKYLQEKSKKLGEKEARKIQEVSMEKERELPDEDSSFTSEVLEVPGEGEIITEVTVQIRKEVKAVEETNEVVLELPKIAVVRKEAELLLPEKVRKPKEEKQKPEEDKEVEVKEEKRKLEEAEGGKKKKKIPKALVIPAEISSKFGDKSTLVSETTVTTEVTMNEESAEVQTSPEKPLSATVTMKVDSAKRSKSLKSRSASAEEFTFKGEEVKEATMKPKSRTGLPPAPKAKEETEEVELVLGRGERRENTEGILLVELVEELAMIVQASAKKKRKNEVRKEKEMERRKRGHELIEILASFNASEQREVFEIVALQILNEATSMQVQGEALKKRKLPEKLKKQAEIRKPSKVQKPISVTIEAEFTKIEATEPVSASLSICDFETVAGIEKVGKKSRKLLKKPKPAKEETMLDDKNKSSEKLGKVEVDDLKRTEEREIFAKFIKSERSEGCFSFFDEIFCENEQLTVGEIPLKKVKPRKKEKSVEEEVTKEAEISEFDFKLKSKEEPEEIEVEASVMLDFPVLAEEGPFEEVTEMEEMVTVTLPAATLEERKEKETYERVRKRRFGFILPPDQEVIAFRGDTVKIECELVNEEDELTWLINDKPVSEISRCTTEVNSFTRMLRIAEIAPEDSGTRVVAKVGDIVAETVILVEDTPAEIVERLPRRSFGKSGEDITLAVSVTHPAHTIVWQFNGEELPKEEEIYVTAREENVYTLTIKNATYERAGRYSVKVDSSETSTTLVVQGAPVIDEHQLPKSVDFEAHENLAFNIPFRAVPEPTAQCFFNGELLSLGARLQLDIVGDTVRFCRRKTNKNDSGEYMIKISNEFGEVTQTFIANVKGHFSIMIKFECSNLFRFQLL